MTTIVESIPERDMFMEYWNDHPSLIYPIWVDLDKHPANTSLSFLYIRFKDNSNFIIPIEHNDCDCDVKVDLSTSNQSKYVYDKKSLLVSGMVLPNTHDLESMLFFDHYNKFSRGLDISNIEPLVQTYKRIGFSDDLGKIIPIMKWIEILDTITDPIMDYIGYNNHSENTKFIDNMVIPVLSRIEKNGIRIDREKFDSKWNSPINLKNSINDVLYTQYNVYTLTGRPSNRHGGINFGALNKNDGTRSIFIPSNDNIFAQFDYDGYHLRLIGKLIDYELPKTSVHSWLADKYGCSYEESKNRSFKNLYGQISEQDKSIEFFRLTDDYIQDLWKRTIKLGYFTTYVGRRIELSWVDSPNPQKIFNYVLQAMETEINIQVISQILDNVDIPLVMYTYDSFLFNMPKTLLSNTSELKKIKDILESHGFPVYGTYGNTYNDL